MAGRRTHDYHTCRDPDCYLPYCRIWREAREEIQRAYSEGFQDGEAAGFSAGFAAGQAAAGAR